jgi:hypothetical protein
MRRVTRKHRPANRGPSPLGVKVRPPQLISALPLPPSESDIPIRRKGLYPTYRIAEATLTGRAETLARQAQRVKSGPHRGRALPLLVHQSYRAPSCERRRPWAIPGAGPAVAPQVWTVPAIPSGAVKVR